MRLRRSDLTRPGYTRRRRGKGFSYLGTDGKVLKDAGTVARIKALVIPPAWTDVWISTDPRGHVQATGHDAAGRKQYLYHPAWRTARDEAKFDHTRRVAERLPDLRARVAADLAGRGLRRTRVLAAVVRLLDLGAFRVGEDRYARRDEDPSYGLATLRPEHVRAGRGCVVLTYPGKAGVEHTGEVTDGEVCQVLRDLKRRRRGAERLFAYWNPAGRRWQEVRAAEINDYLRETGGVRLTAKDFRTWHGTVKAAGELAAAGPRKTRTGRRKAVSRAMREVADLLGNTPAVARASYVDPRVIDRYEEGEVAAGGTEEETLDLLTDEEE